MKKFMASFALLTTLFACQSKTENTANIPVNASGYNVDSSTNVDLVLKSIKAINESDTVAYRTFYAANAVFHDNLDSMNLDQNVSLVNAFKAKGVGFKIVKVEPIWEAVNKVAAPNGVTNYVISYILAEFTKGDQKVQVIMNGVDAVKDGKIVEEWNTYDTKKIADLLK
jgi:limonene-1,2-epoxide hydrolase